MRRNLPGPLRLEHPAPRRPGTGESVPWLELAAYRAKHGLRRVRNEWPAWSEKPIQFVTDEPSLVEGEVEQQ